MCIRDSINPEAFIYKSNFGMTEVDLFSLNGQQIEKVSENGIDEHSHHHTHSDLHSISLRRKQPIKAVTLTLFFGDSCASIGTKPR